VASYIVGQTHNDVAQHLRWFVKRFLLERSADSFSDLKRYALFARPETLQNLRLQNDGRVNAAFALFFGR
jgi:hypothetical protein